MSRYVTVLEDENHRLERERDDALSLLAMMKEAREEALAELKRLRAKNDALVRVINETDWSYDHTREEISEDLRGRVREVLDAPADDR